MKIVKQILDELEEYFVDCLIKRLACQKLLLSCIRLSIVIRIPELGSFGLSLGQTTLLLCRYKRVFAYNCSFHLSRIGLLHSNNLLDPF